MAIVKVYNKEGKELKDLKLDSNIFEATVKSPVIHQVAVAMMANQRQNLAHTKDKSEVRGGGRKPWKQKGTGRARHGSSRSPIWIGGGVTFGPRNDRNFSKKVNKKVRRTALKMALSSRVEEKAMKVIDLFDISEYKTKNVFNILKNLELVKNVLVVSEENNQKLIKSVINLPKVDIIEAKDLNLLEVLRYKYILFSEKAVDVVQNILNEEKKEKAVAKEKIEKTEKTNKKSVKKSKTK